LLRSTTKNMACAMLLEAYVIAIWLSLRRREGVSTSSLLVAVVALWPAGVWPLAVVVAAVVVVVVVVSSCNG